MKTEKSLFIAFIIGYLLKIINVPGHSLILLLSLFGLGFIYFFGAFYFFCDKEIKKQNIAFSIVTGILVSIIPVGLFLKIQFWPGGNFFLILGSIFSLILLGISLFMNNKSKEDLKKYYRNMIIRLSVLTFFSIIFLFICCLTLLKIQH